DKVITWPVLRSLRGKGVNAVYVACIQRSKFRCCNFVLARAKHVPSIEDRDFQVVNANSFPHFERESVLDFAISEGLIDLQRFPCRIFLSGCIETIRMIRVSMRYEDLPIFTQASA